MSFVVTVRARVIPREGKRPGYGITSRYVVSTAREAVEKAFILLETDGGMGWSVSIMREQDEVQAA